MTHYTKRSQALCTLEKEIRGARAEAVALAKAVIKDKSTPSGIGESEPTSYCEAWVEALVKGYYECIDDDYDTPMLEDLEYGTDELQGEKATRACLLYTSPSPRDS